MFERLLVTQVDRDGAEPELVFTELYSARMRLSNSHVVFVTSMHSAPLILIKHYPSYPIGISVPVQDRNAEFHDDLASVTARLAALNIPAFLCLSRDRVDS